MVLRRVADLFFLRRCGPTWSFLENSTNGALTGQSTSAEKRLILILVCLFRERIFIDSRNFSLVKVIEKIKV